MTFLNPLDQGLFSLPVEVIACPPDDIGEPRTCYRLLETSSFVALNVWQTEQTRAEGPAKISVHNDPRRATRADKTCHLRTIEKQYNLFWTKHTKATLDTSIPYCSGDYLCLEDTRLCFIGLPTKKDCIMITVVRVCILSDITCTCPRWWDLVC